MTGAAGGLIFQHYNGRTFGRTFPVLFHYQPTPLQQITQSKYYNIRSIWLPFYRQIKPYIPQDQLKQSNAYNSLTRAVYQNLGVFSSDNEPNLLRKFGFDVYDRLSLRLGNWTLYYQEPYYYITFWDFNYIAKIDFEPKYAHALYLCSDFQQIQYCIVEFNSHHLTFIFDNLFGWFPDHDFDMFVALSDEQYFSNFFY